MLISPSSLVRRSLLIALLLGCVLTLLYQRPQKSAILLGQVSSADASSSASSADDCSRCDAVACTNCGRAGMYCVAEGTGATVCLPFNDIAAPRTACCGGFPSSVSSVAASSVQSSEVAASSFSSDQSASESDASLSSSADSSPAASGRKDVVGVDAGMCGSVQPDPVTGTKLVYCCTDEVYAYQQQASQAEFTAFMRKLASLEDLSVQAAMAVFAEPYSGSLHQQNGWTSLCGEKIDCDACAQGRICGNGTVEAPEQCDDGTRNSDTVPDACRRDCTPPRCGDNVIDQRAGETCDMGSQNRDAPNVCRALCTLPSCGDGIIDAINGETCDSGPENADSIPDRCRENCKLPACGDGVEDAQEECDDGNRVDGDGCMADCTKQTQIVARCGDGTVQAGEECDDDNAASGDGCSSICRREVLAAPRCGDGGIDPGEQCDDGDRNANVPDTCREDCSLPRCGDGLQDTGEECDDLNRRDRDGCSTVCKREVQLARGNACGNGIVDPGEECDAGTLNANIPDRCRSLCTFPACGDGIRDAGEQCDDRNSLDRDGCSRRCTREFCGDGRTQADETCDDGNAADGDGCSSVCLEELAQTAFVSAAPLYALSSVPSDRSRGTFGLAQGGGLILSSSSSVRSREPFGLAQGGGLILSSSSSVRSRGGLLLSSASSDRSRGGLLLSSSNTLQPAAPAAPPTIIVFPRIAADITSFPDTVTYAPSVSSARQTPDAGPAVLSVVAMSAAGALAWARKKRRCAA